MKELFNVGDMIYGYCNGYFGRDDYEDKLCIMVTEKYAVFQYTDGDMKGKGAILNYSERLTKELINKWNLMDNYRLV